MWLASARTSSLYPLFVAFWGAVDLPALQSRSPAQLQAPQGHRPALASANLVGALRRPLEEWNIQYILALCTLIEKDLQFLPATQPPPIGCRRDWAVMAVLTIQSGDKGSARAMLRLAR
jgi:hypothetical protein